MSNPFIAPAELAEAPRAVDGVEVYRELVLAMRFPHLMLGSLGALFAVVLIGVGLVLLVGAGRATGQESALAMAGAAVYGVLGAIYLVPAGLLVRSGIAGLVGRNDPEQLVVSLRAQLWFWRVLALYVLGLTALYAGAFVLLIGVGLLG